MSKNHFIMNLGKSSFIRPIYFSISILIIGILFKIMHWNYANELLIGAVSLIVLFSFLRFLNIHQKKPKDYIKLVLVVCWLIGYLLQNLHWANQVFFVGITRLSFVAWLCLELLDYFTQDKRKKKSNH